MALSRRTTPLGLETNLREHIAKALLGLRESLRAQCDDTARAKKAIADHFGRLVLTPTLCEGRTAFKATGQVTVNGPSGTVD